MTSIIEKRVSLHKDLAEQKEQAKTLEIQISRLQSLANIGTATCMIAHEINNLLTPLAGYAAVALKNPNDKGLTEKALQRTVQNCERATKIMESILAVTNGESQQKKNVQMLSLVEEVFTCLCRDFARDGITVRIQIPADLTVWAVPVQIQQVLMNLILNAREAMLPRGGVLTIRAGDTADTVQIEVADTGCGIEPADLDKVFEPFFTTKAEKNLPDQRSGAGLGLVFCKRIIDGHRGCICIESEQGKGTTFNITLPKPR